MNNNKIAQGIVRAFLGVFFITFGWIYLNIVFAPHSISGTYSWWISACAGVFILAAMIGLFLLCKKYVSKWRPRTIYLVFAAMMVVMFGALLYFGYIMQVHPEWDFAAVYNAATNSARGGSFQDSAAYFAQFSNNLFILGVEIILYKMAYKITGSTSVYIGVAFNVFLIILTIIFVFLIAKKIWNPHTALFCGSLCFLFVPFYGFAPIFYTDTFALPFVVIPLYLFICALKQTNKVKLYGYLIGASVLLMFGFKMKATVVILLVAMIFYLALNQKLSSFLKKAGVLLVTFGIVLFSYQTIFNYIKPISNEEYDQYKVPLSHWVMMGLGENGLWSGSDYNYTWSFPTLAERTNADNALIQTRLENLGAWGLFEHLTNKAARYTWGDGEYTSVLYLKWEPRYPENRIGKVFYSDYTYYYAQGFQLALLSLLMISLIMGIKRGKADYSTLLNLAICGLFVFLLGWETAPRYVFHFTPLLILLGADTIIRLTNFDYKQLINRITNKQIPTLNLEKKEIETDITE